jgi:hypothetical protein
VAHEFVDGWRREAGAVFLGLDLLGDADAHVFSPRKGNG